MMKSISASSMNMYDQCPLAWKYNYIDKLLQLPNPAFIIGTNYHKALELFHTGHKPEQILIDLKKEMIKNKTDEEIDRFGLVRQMFEKYIAMPVEGKIIENEFRFRITIPDIPVPLYGFVDRVDENKIVEYKTSSFDYKEKDIKTIQSLIYTYAVKKEKGKLLPVVFSVNNKKKAKNPNYKLQELKIQRTEEELKELEQIFKDFYIKVTQDKSFKPRLGSHCHWCAYGNSGTSNCPHRL